MATRRDFRSRLGQVAQTLLASHLRDQENETESERVAARQRELADQNATLKILEKATSSPAFATLLQRGGVKDIQGVPIDTFQQTNEQAAEPVIDAIGKAKSLPELGSKDAAFESFRANAINNGRGITSLTPLTNLLNTYDAQEGRIKANDDYSVDLGGRKVFTDAQNQIEGTVAGQNNTEADRLRMRKDEQDQDAGVLNANLNRFLSDTINRANQTERGTRGEKVKTAGATAGAAAGAAAAAQNPYENPTILYGTDGTAHAVKFNPDGTSTEVPIPPGLGKQPKALGQQELDQVSALNSAEVQGVKVLQELHKLGLDKSNNPLDPRWQKFLVSRLGIAPEDYTKADIQQRTAYVNALLTRSLMGARPSKYVAEIIQQHLPQGTQTGQQLYHVLNNVLEQGAGRRREIGALTGREMNNPISGMTYDQFLKMVGSEPSVDNDADIQDFLKRPTR